MKACRAYRLHCLERGKCLSAANSMLSLTSLRADSSARRSVLPLMRYSLDTKPRDPTNISRMCLASSLSLMPWELK